jgi:hypothetical protein
MWAISDGLRIEPIEVLPPAATGYSPDQGRSRAALGRPPLARQRRSEPAAAIRRGGLFLT